MSVLLRLIVLLALTATALSCAGCGCTETHQNRAEAEPPKESQEPVQPASTESEAPLDQSAPSQPEAESAETQTAEPDSGEPKPEGVETSDRKSPQPVGGSVVPSANQETGRQGPAGTGDARQAKRKAREASANADKASKRGNHAEAFKQARAGWEAVSPFADDAECRSLAKSLLEQTGRYAAKANSVADPDSSKTIVVE